jgi:hypothetical protein
MEWAGLVAHMVYMALKILDEGYKEGISSSVVLCYFVIVRSKYFNRNFVFKYTITSDLALFKYLVSNPSKTAGQITFNVFYI